jgi:hypothetical protein
MQKLNKVVTMVMMGMVIFSMTCCHKEGVYNPSKKISKIYYQTSTGVKTLSQTWSWEKNKLVRIDYSGGSFITLEYDKSRLSKITYSGGAYQEFEYDGSKLTAINEYTANRLFDGSYSFEHDGSKISEMTYEEYYDASKSKAIEASDKSLMASTLRFILPVPLSDDNSLPTQKIRKAGVYRYVVTFTWKGGNVESITESSTDSQVASTTTYTYDKKKNPYCDALMDIGVSSLSKNNILSVRYSNSVSNYAYSYTYDGNVPTERNGVYTYSTGTSMNSSTSVTYYEYK